MHLTETDREVAACLNELSGAVEPLLSLRAAAAAEAGLRESLQASRAALAAIEPYGMAAALRAMVERTEPLLPRSGHDALTEAVRRSWRALLLKDGTLHGFCRPSH